MTEADVIRLMRVNLGTFLPRICPRCRRTLSTLREYILSAHPRGRMTSLEAEAGDWDAVHPSGALAYADCRCGAALSLCTVGMPLDQRRSMLHGMRGETERRGLSPKELSAHRRAETRKRGAGRTRTRKGPRGIVSDTKPGHTPGPTPPPVAPSAAAKR